MSFTIERVEYRDFRNMESYSLELDPRLTILVGPNAVGKTNCVEGIQLLTAGFSFKRAKNGDLVRAGCGQGRVGLHASGEKRALDLVYDIFPSKKLLSLNGKRRPAAEGRGLLPSIVFYPDELLVVKGSAGGRRDLFDDLGEQLNKTYATVVAAYKRAVFQRNNLLRAETLDENLLTAWTESLIRAGSALTTYRISLVARLSPYISRAYGNLAGGEEASLRYMSSFLSDGDDDGGLDVGGLNERFDRLEVETRFADRLRELRTTELRRCQTMVGPHLDDIRFIIDGKDARAFGSQGQQRTFVLAVKLAQVELIQEITGQFPVFLLDDVMSELDAARRSRLFDLVHDGMQTVVTTTNLAYFRPGELESAKAVTLGGL